jgi:hypothetical protein
MLGRRHVHKKNPGRRMGGTRTDQGFYRSWSQRPWSGATHKRAKCRPRYSPNVWNSRLAVDGGATFARNGLYDLDLFAGTGGLDKVPDVDNALEAGVRVILFLRGWVRRCARLCGGHWGPFPLVRVPGGGAPRGRFYVYRYFSTSCEGFE